MRQKIMKIKIGIAVLQVDQSGRCPGVKLQPTTPRLRLVELGWLKPCNKFTFFYYQSTVASALSPPGTLLPSTMEFPRQPRRESKYIHKYTLVKSSAFHSAVPVYKLMPVLQPFFVSNFA